MTACETTFPSIHFSADDLVLLEHISSSKVKHATILGTVHSYNDERLYTPYNGHLLLDKEIFTGVAVLTVDSVGRRPLLLWGVGGMTVALIGLGGSSLTLTGSVSTWSSVAALLLYVGAYQVLQLTYLLTQCRRAPAQLGEILLYSC